MYLLTCVRAGHFELGDMEVDIRENGDYEGLHAVLSGTKTLAGSVTTLISCVRKYMEFTGCSLAEAIEAASLHPAQALGIDDERGSLEFGRFADIVLLDVDLNVQATSVHECFVFAQRPGTHRYACTWCAGMWKATSRGADWLMLAPAHQLWRNPSPPRWPAPHSLPVLVLVRVSVLVLAVLVLAVLVRMLVLVVVLASLH